MNKAPLNTIVEIGTFKFQGKEFSALGSIQDETNGFMFGYVKRAENGAYSLTTWHGEHIAPLTLKNNWRQYVSDLPVHFYSWRAWINNRKYSGRNLGEGMFLKLRSKAIK